MTMREAALSGRHVLVVEDDYFLAKEIALDLRAAGAVVLGPAPTVAAALDRLEGGDPLHAAVVDINLAGEKAFPVADTLVARGIPFLFTTGYDRVDIPPRFVAVRSLQKPNEPGQVVGALAAMLAPPSG